MSDETQATNAPATEAAATGAGIPKFDLGYLRNAFIRRDIAMPLAIAGVLVVLLVPLPTWLLDGSLAVSITFSVVILMTVVFLQKPLELTSFPTILLIATLLRLALNVASTRLILTDGHTGPAAAGRMIQAFGNFVVGGNYVIGIIVFGILVIINFIVITKGAGRIAEVAARFTLDAMPGKQMAIDADLSSGLITEDQARARRKELEQESSFYGAMDGASKFVRGDAIAGLLITFINVVGGIIIGTAQKDMSMAVAAENYTLLTIGDGLVSQIPAIIVSVAAGMLVTKAGLTETVDKAVLGQLSGYPTALGVAAFLLLVMSVIPQIPALPLLLLGAGVGTAAWYTSRRAATRTAEDTLAEEQAEREAAAVAEEPIANALQIDLVRLELGYGLLPLINADSEHRLTDQIKALRRQLASDVGFVMPAVRIQDNLQLPANTYIIRVKEIEAGRGDLRPNMLLVMDPKGGELNLPGETTVEPTFGLPALWVPEHGREEAIFRGLTVVDPATVITTHLTEVVKEQMAELLSYTTLRCLRLFKGIPKVVRV